MKEKKNVLFHFISYAGQSVFFDWFQNKVISSENYESLKLGKLVDGAWDLDLFNTIYRIKIGWIVFKEKNVKVEPCHFAPVYDIEYPAKIFMISASDLKIRIISCNSYLFK